MSNIEFRRGRPNVAGETYLVRIYDSGSGHCYTTEIMTWSGRNWSNTGKEIENGSDVFFAGPIECVSSMVLRLANEEDVAERAKLSKRAKLLLNRKFGRRNADDFKRILK